MNPADLSIFVFGIYIVVVVGCGFVFMPNVVLPMFKLPKTNEPWIRILGFIVALLGVYYINAALHGLTAFHWSTVWGRFAVLAFFIILSALKQTKPTIIIFGVIDSAGAVWTLLTLI